MERQRNAMRSASLLLHTPLVARVLPTYKPIGYQATASIAAGVANASEHGPVRTRMARAVKLMACLCSPGTTATCAVSALGGRLRSQKLPQMQEAQALYW